MPPVVRPDCPCPKVTCKRYMLCDACEASHAPRGGLPYCRRPKRSLWGKIKKMLGFRD